MLLFKNTWLLNNAKDFVLSFIGLSIGFIPSNVNYYPKKLFEKNFRFYSQNEE